MTPEAPAQDRHHLDYLDGLRGLAIMLVVMVHVGQRVLGMPVPFQNLTFYGVRGVQLFFIVSGLTLTIAHRGKPLHLANFAARRFCRIAPMFYLGAALYLTLAAIPAIDPSFNPINVAPRDIALTGLFLHGWSIKAYNLVVPGGWSIADEAMFYVAFPLLLLLLRKPARYVVALGVIYLLAGVTYFAIRRFVHGDPRLVQGFAVSFWLCNLPAFATGCWLALRPAAARISPRAGGMIMAAAMTGMVVDSQLRNHSNLLASIILLALLVWAAGLARPKWLSSRAMTKLGEVSFSLYILHFAVLKFLLPVIRWAQPQLGWLPTLPLAYAATLLIAASLAALTFRFVEAPFIRLGRTLFAPRAV